ncbi:MAG TPA: DUF1588 domain-containing protein [Polyangiaceae bacterium]|nr:DUF1588 domain-containing protein [Polyangiaceae bacterium]
MRALPHRFASVALWCGLSLACTGNLGDAGAGASGGNAASGAGNDSSGGVTNAGGASAKGGANTGAVANSGGKAGAPAAPFVALDSVARRLSRAEFDNVLRDVLKDTTAPASKTLVEDEYAPYDNDYTLQEASQTLIDGLSTLAEGVAKRALADPAQRAALVPCTPQGAGDAACFRQTIEQTGARLMRRPLSSQEVNAYLALSSFATENNPSVPHDFYTGVELFLRAVLQDPEFLYRIEVGSPSGTAGVFKLNSFEIASRLSFLIAGSTPDDALLDQARAGALESATARVDSARRLLADDRARAQLHRYHSLWLGYRAIPHPAALIREFDSETTALIDRVVFEEHRDYRDLFTLKETYLDVALADHYGLPHPSGAQGWVSYGNSGRAGILSHGSVLAAFSKFSDTSPTQRGIFVQTRLLCQDIPPPPANVNVDQPPAGGASMCKTDRYAQHRTSSSCAACHGRIDPIGLGLEKYDIAGRYREHDDGLPQCLLDGVGELPGYGTFQGPGELAQKLTENDLIDACAVRQYLTFAAGRRLRTDEQALVDAELASFRGNKRDLAEMIVTFAASDAFALRKEPTP